jgi:hypothetical protein
MRQESFGGWSPPSPSEACHGVSPGPLRSVSEHITFKKCLKIYCCNPLDLMHYSFEFSVIYSFSTVCNIKGVRGTEAQQKVR